jgi:hypothetical protein
MIHKYRVASKEERTLDGFVFGSKGEMKRWIFLQKIERAGTITDLQRQITFKIEVLGKKSVVMWQILLTFKTKNT